MNTSDTHTAEDNQAKLTQNENLGGNLPEQAEPSVCDIQNHAEIEKLLGTDELAYGYVYQNGQRTEYMFQGTPENIGYFIDKCPDQELLDEIKKTLIPIQKGEAKARCSPSRLITTPSSTQMRSSLEAPATRIMERYQQRWR